MPSLDPVNTLPRLARSTLNAAAPRPKNKNENVRSDPITHHDIVKQYRKGLTAVVDRRVYISYNQHHAVPKSFVRCCSGRDSCMLTSRCMLPWLRSAPYPALCPCEPGARSATCKPCPMALVPDRTVPCSRPPGPNLDLASSDYTQGPCVGFTYIYNYPSLGQQKSSYSPTMTS